MKQGLSILIFTAFLFSGCAEKQAEKPLFQLLRKDRTGLDFENVLKQTSEFNVFNYMYFFNGGGVAAGDFNNDGLIDLYFTSNMGPNKLFLNRGKLKFEDVTEQAGVAGTEGGWTTGASVVDINNDGLLDIYVSQMGDYQTIKGQNQFFVCQGIKDGVPYYDDMAIAYGLDLIGFGTQAAFFDYDLDGDLDMFQLNHSLHGNGTFGQKKTFEGVQHPEAGDKLMRNDGGGQGVAKFTEVTLQAGIKSTVIGYGLGIVTGDVNNDGWPDIFIGNDFHENDYLYINQQDGTFRDVLTEATQHISRFSMGVDMADINNDGWNDLVSLDMLPEDRFILKTSIGEDDFGTFNFKLGYGYHHQFARNNLHLNRGFTPLSEGGSGAFSEIGMFADIHATDWSWAPLFADFDHDGWKDLFISNGIVRRMNDLDYVSFRETSELRYKEATNNLEESDLVVVEKMPRIKLKNKFFRNDGQLHFADIGGRVADNAETYSNGAITADLDNDGDLDIVVNNIEDEPFIYQNLLADSPAGKDQNGYLSLKLSGPAANVNAIGTRVVVHQKDSLLGPGFQVYEHFPVRGYQSSCEAPLHIGLGGQAFEGVDVIWPDGTFESFLPKANQTETLKWRPGLPKYDFSRLQKMPDAPFQFADETHLRGLEFQHVENPFIEFHRERLIPFMVSADGPALAIADVDGDGRDDVFIGGAKHQPSALFLQPADARFVKKQVPVFHQDSLLEDVDARFIDLDNDGDLDLAVAAGGNEFTGQHFALQQRVYLNDGKGNFTRQELPGVFMTAACVLPADFDGDGLTDLFFGARAVPWKYGLVPESALLRNLGNGKFENVAAADLKAAGLVKSGHWHDLDADGDLDLVLAMDWAPITVFENEKGKFTRREINDQTGWWNFALPHDFDGDGDVDILAGNLGENARFKPTPQQPVRMYVNDFDDNDQVEQVLTYYLGGVETPFANYKEIIGQLPGLKKKYLLAKDFANASMDELFGKEKLAKAIRYEANTFTSLYFENTGKGDYTAHRLPSELQFSTLHTGLLSDLDGDNKGEVLLGGNFFQCNLEMGRYDASYGNILSIGKGGKMGVFPIGNQRIKGQVRRIGEVSAAGQRFFIFAKNDAPAQVLRYLPKGEGQLTDKQAK